MLMLLPLPRQRRRRSVVLAIVTIVALSVVAVAAAAAAAGAGASSGRPGRCARVASLRIAPLSQSGSSYGYRGSSFARGIAAFAWGYSNIPHELQRQRQQKPSSGMLLVPQSFRVRRVSSAGYRGATIPAAATAFLPRNQHEKRLASLDLWAQKPLSSTSSSSTLLSHDEVARYSRHLVLSDVGVRGQEALRDASVLVIGAGGLGSPVLLYLAAAGVGHIGIVDNDVVDTSNLQRQVVHAVSTVGLSKCESAQRRIHDLNPHVHVRLYCEEFTAATARRIVSEGFDGNNHRPWNVVIDGSDNFPTKYLVNDVCAMYGIPWVYSAILAFEGQLSVFNYQDAQNDNDDDDAAPDYRDLLPTPPPPGDVPSCAEGGVLGVLPGTLGCLQATEAIKLILGRSRQELLVGRVLVVNAMTMKFNEVGLQRSAHRLPITELIDYQGFCGGPKNVNAPVSPHQQQSSQPPLQLVAGQRTMDESADESSSSEDASFHVITPHECWDKLVSNEWSPWVLDVRLQTEHDICHLPFTDGVVPHRTVQPAHIPATGDVLVYCKAGVRGAKACASLVAAGVDARRLYNLQGGILQWQKDIDPSMPRY